jgi:hypothetical protein
MCVNRYFGKKSSRTRQDNPGRTTCGVSPAHTDQVQKEQIICQGITSVSSVESTCFAGLFGKRKGEDDGGEVISAVHVWNPESRNTPAECRHLLRPVWGRVPGGGAPVRPLPPPPPPRPERAASGARCAPSRLETELRALPGQLASPPANGPALNGPDGVDVRGSAVLIATARAGRPATREGLASQQPGCSCHRRAPNFRAIGFGAVQGERHLFGLQLLR